MIYHFSPRIHYQMFSIPPSTNHAKAKDKKMVRCQEREKDQSQDIEMDRKRVVSNLFIYRRRICRRIPRVLRLFLCGSNDKTLVMKLRVLDQKDSIFYLLFCFRDSEKREGW